MAITGYSDPISSDVVGYASANTKEGFAAVTTSFKAVSGEINLQDLTVTGYNHADGFDGDVYLETLTETGAADETYIWLDIPKDEEDPDSEAFYGWYDLSDTYVKNVTINPGDGFWVHSDNTAYGIQSAGAVITTSTAVLLREDGFTMVGNPIPTSVNLQSISVSGYNHEDGFDGDVYMETLTETGAADETYIWLDIPKDEDDPDSVAFYGWYNLSDEYVDKVEIGTGEALWTHSDSSDYKLVFPGVTL